MLPPKIEAMKAEILKTLSWTPVEEGGHAEGPSVNAVRLLAVIAQHHGEAVGVSALYKKVGLGGDSGDRAKEELEKRQLATFARQQTGKRGAAPLLASLTTHGRNLLESRGITGVRAGGSCGTRHRYGQITVQKSCEKRYHGATVSIEAWLGDTFVDVLVETSAGERIAHEIALSAHHQHDNAEKDLAAGCSKVVFVCMEGEFQEFFRKAVLKGLSPEQASRVEFKSIKEFQT